MCVFFFPSDEFSRKPYNSRFIRFKRNA